MARRGPKKEWPSWRYGPNNQKRIFNEGEKIPDGWEDHPDKVKVKAQPESSTSTRAPRKAAAKTAEKKDGDKGGEKTDAEKAEEARYRAESIEFLKAAGRDVSSITDETPLDEIESMLDDATKEGESK